MQRGLPRIQQLPRPSWQRSRTATGSAYPTICGCSSWSQTAYRSRSWTGWRGCRPVAEYFRIVDRIPAALTQAADSDDPQRYYCFGDYNIEGSFWGVRLNDDPAAPTLIQVFWHDGGGYEVASSFRGFLARYLWEGPDCIF